MKNMSSYKQKTNKKKRSGLKPTEKSRKQIRKEQRKQKKINRVLYFTKRKELHARARGLDEGVDTDHKPNDDEVVKKAVRVQKKIENDATEKKKRKLEQLKQQKRKQETKLLEQANEKEDKMIKKLEKQLKLNKRKKKTVPKSFVEDGLDYLLNFCLEKDRAHLAETEKELIENNFENEMHIGYSEISNKSSIEKSEDIDLSENDSNDGNDSYNDSNSEQMNSESESENINEDENNDDQERSPGNSVKAKAKQIKSMQNKDGNDTNDDNEDLWEDIYGRKRDKKGNVIPSTNKYIPPAARMAPQDMSLDNEKLLSLKRQLKGCLNRVTEHNMHSIANQIEAMYMTNSRNSMNYLLTELTIESLVSYVISPGRLISEHMMLIAILHANIGIEVGANFLEKLVVNFIKALEESQDVENKQLDNMVLMISNLYNFKVFGYKLLYQILDKLMTRFTEKEIESILLILKTVGFSLRKDDPIALKEFIQNLQRKASHEDGTNSRVKFMLEILLAIKNNNINKIPQYDPSHVEHLKKVMKSVIRKGNTVTQFNVSLDDLLHADERGKWWIVGSAWSGSNNVDDKPNVRQQTTFNFGDKIMKLAQKQRMNTDTRKNIFCVLMTAEDYLDAFEKLLHLGLKDHQESEIIHVLMHCCLQEKKFNRYYAVLAQKLCEYNRKYQLTIQYTFWDKLKTLESYGHNQLNNLAQFLTHLFIEKCLALSILKIIQFTELDKHTMRFIKQILLNIFLHENELACMQVFERISISPQLEAFRESLRLFISCFLVKNVDSYNILEEQKMMLNKRAESVDKILTTHGSRVIF
ncbi:nucleolar MIF4G domain-containing protein 1 [Ceratina calcarata]|uniref:Nucleolar MIF4G domain-containing protein 1 n=1 Tax=Ceratina calcarata TaxID=156304 RepID=A0AAJ7J9E3_9HYME|nr:nucleolar MIF4G domain-containing protein 1 [Ceratina calcarata]